MYTPILFTSEIIIDIAETVVQEKHSRKVITEKKNSPGSENSLKFVTWICVHGKIGIG